MESKANVQGITVRFESDVPFMSDRVKVVVEGPRDDIYRLMSEIFGRRLVVGDGKNVYADNNLSVWP